MDLSTMVQSLQSTLGALLPRLLGALGILLVGWLVAVIIRAGLRKALGFFKVNERVRATSGTEVDLEAGVAKGAYYVILGLVLLAFFNALSLELVSGPLQALLTELFAFAPRLVAAVALLIVAWIIATLVRRIVTRALAGTRLDERLSEPAGMRPMSESLGNVLYWLVILLFLPAILGALELQGLLRPVQTMIDKLLGMLPNVFAGLILGLVGWFVARIVRDLTSNLLAATGVDRISERTGLRGAIAPSRLVGLLVYVFVLVPALIAALNAMKIEAIAAPATEMLETFMAAIPNVFGAALILLVAYVVSRFVAGLSVSLLSGAGFDRLPEKLGVGQAFQGGATPSKLVGVLIVFFVMLFASVEAAGRLGFSQLSELVSTFIEFGGQVVLGTVIIAVGFWISNLARNTVVRIGGEGAAAIAAVARFAILGIVIAMGLRAMGLADDIVNLAFGLTLGAVAVAFALSFGLGGREAAGRLMEQWLGRLRKP